MTYCTTCFHNIMWFYLKACIKNGGFLFWTISIRKLKFWSHRKNNDMKCNKVSKNIKCQCLAHTFIFPSLFFYSVRITSSTFKGALRNDWGTLRCFSEPTEPNTHQSSKANGIRKISNPWKEAGHCWKMCARASPSASGEQHYLPQAQLDTHSAAFNAPNSVNPARVQQILPSLPHSSQSSSLGDRPCTAPKPRCHGHWQSPSQRQQQSEEGKKHLKYLWSHTFEKAGQLISSQHLTLPL